MGGAGAERDFDDLFREHYPRLVALGAAMSGSTEVARELAQETMLRAHGRWAVLADFDHPGAWLRRVMTNLLIDHHRTRIAETSALGRVGERPAIVPDDDMTDVSHWMSLISPLPMRQRAIVTLHYGDDRSIKEVAAMLDISSGTVKSALAKARRRLEESLREEANHG